MHSGCFEAGWCYPAFLSNKIGAGRIACSSSAIPFFNHSRSALSISSRLAVLLVGKPADLKLAGPWQKVKAGAARCSGQGLRAYAQAVRASTKCWQSEVSTV